MPFESSASIYNRQEPQPEPCRNEESSSQSSQEQEVPKPFNSMDEFEKGFAEFMEFMTSPVDPNFESSSDESSSSDSVQQEP